MEYENIILLKDYDTEQVDGIIMTNVDTSTIQEAITKAKNKYYELEEQNNILCGINCEYEYIVYCLQDKYDCEVVQFWDKHNEVYY